MTCQNNYKTTNIRNICTGARKLLSVQNACCKACRLSSDPQYPGSMPGVTFNAYLKSECYSNWHRIPLVIAPQLNLAESRSSGFSAWTSMEIWSRELLRKTSRSAVWLQPTDIHTLAQTRADTFSQQSSLKINANVYNCNWSQPHPFPYI